MRRVRPLPLHPDGKAGSRAAIAEPPAQCHGMSCFPCGGCICDGHFRHDAAVPDGCSGYSIRFPGFDLRHVSLLSIHLRSVLPAAGLAVRRDPNSRVSCAGGRVSAPARFARLIARMCLRARARRRAHLAGWPNRGLSCVGSLLPRATRGCYRHLARRQRRLRRRAGPASGGAGPAPRLPGGTLKGVEDSRRFRFGGGAGGRRERVPAPGSRRV